MNPEQNPSHDEDCVIWLKAQERMILFCSSRVMVINEMKIGVYERNPVTCILGLQITKYHCVAVEKN